MSLHLICAVELAVLFATQIDWKPLGDCPVILEKKIGMNPDFRLSVDVEMTLTKRCLSDVFPDQVIEATLLDAAFRPKTYNVELAKGRFAKADWLWWQGQCPPKHSETWFGLRIVFDKSPYPPLEEWIKDRASWRAAEMNEFCGYRDFYQDAEESVYRAQVRKPGQKGDKRRLRGLGGRVVSATEKGHRPLDTYRRFEFYSPQNERAIKSKMCSQAKSWLRVRH